MLRDRVLRGVAALGRRRGSRAVQGLVGMSRRLVASFDGTDGDPYDLETNGERWLLDRLGSEDLGVVVDVGANVGDWTAAALGAGAGMVHAFEIVDRTADRFADRHGDDPRVRLHRIGLGAEPGTVRVHHYPDHPALTTTATAHPHDLPHEDLDVQVTTGDRFVADEGVDHVDLLKIDVEGEEPGVLAGFEATLAAGRIDVVQFEYGVVAVLSRFLVIDFYELFDRHGFTVGPLGADGVDFGDYALALERFRHPYFVAVARRRPDLVHRLMRRDRTEDDEVIRMD